MSAQETLLKLMCVPTSRFDAVCRTSDGFYLARPIGSVGYDAFLGQPKPPHDGPGRDLMLDTWNALSDAERRQVASLAANPGDGSPIRLAEDFGVPV